MKKLMIFLSCLVYGFFIIGTNSVNGQWSADIYYDTTGCDCGSITSRTIDWELWDTELDQEVEKDDNVALGGNYPYTISGTATITFDQQLRYQLTARVKFKVGSIVCCDGWAVDYSDSDQLVEGIAELYITME
jgi:hypothetical protein